MKVKMVAMMAAMACMAGVAHANLLVNGGFEDEGSTSGTASNWSGGYGYASWSAMSGEDGVFFGAGNSSVSMYQESISVVGSEVYAGGMYFHSLNGYTNQATSLSIDWFNSSFGALGGTVSTSFVCTADMAWNYYAVTGAAPASAAYATFTVTALNNTQASGALAMDDADFLAVPEPASALLFGLSSLGFIVWKRLRK